VTLTTIVTGTTAKAREAAIASVLDPGVPTALILEGLPDGSLSDTLFERPQLHIVRIAPGCPCCTGNLTMRVNLNRLLRRSPARLYIGVATTAHLDQVHAFLSQPPYDKLLKITKDLQA
jgi:G3E family GTPase